MAAPLFITATDTDAGKTYVTVALLRALQASGRAARAIKPVASGGVGANNPDLAALLAAQGLSNASAINRYCFAAPLAPQQAAAAEGTTIDATELIDWCRAQMRSEEQLLIEAVGGLLVPLADGFYVADWLDRLPECRVVLVVRCRLGGINHMLLTLNELARRGRMPALIVLNDADGAGEAMVELHRQALAGYASSNISVVPLFHSADADYASRRLQVYFIVPE